MAHGGRQIGDKLITQRKFQLFTKMRNACKSRKCSHDQIEKKNCQRAQCLKKGYGLLFSEEIKHYFSQVCGT